jgi:ribulose-phosphate 3-epimerase
LKPVCSGSNVIVAGTAIFGSDKPEEVIATFKSAVDTAQVKIHE